MICGATGSSCGLWWTDWRSGNTEEPDPDPVLTVRQVRPPGAATATATATAREHRYTKCHVTESDGHTLEQTEQRIINEIWFKIRFIDLLID